MLYTYAPPHPAVGVSGDEEASRKTRAELQGWRGFPHRSVPLPHTPCPTSSRRPSTPSSGVSPSSFPEALRPPDSQSLYSNQMKTAVPGSHAHLFQSLRHPGTLNPTGTALHTSFLSRGAPGTARGQLSPLASNSVSYACFVHTSIPRLISTQ